MWLAQNTEGKGTKKLLYICRKMKKFKKYRMIQRVIHPTLCSEVATVAAGRPYGNSGWAVMATPHEWKNIGIIDSLHVSGYSSYVG